MKDEKITARYDVTSEDVFAILDYAAKYLSDGEARIAI
jgi:uncharacterized protein (DUF433 family)